MIGGGKKRLIEGGDVDEKNNDERMGNINLWV